MSIEFESCNTEERVTLTLDGRDRQPLHYRRSYGYETSWRFMPTRITALWVNGELSSITLTGPRLLKNGQSDLETGEAVWADRDLAEAPEWVRTLIPMASVYRAGKGS